MQWGSIDAKSQQRAVLFGFWDQQHGLDRLPVNPIVNIGKLEHTVRPVLDNIELMAPQLPFTPIDDYELWLLDSAR
ncbi:MAG: hypothetical protein PVH98_08745 [Gammaproteobacteria bacterium]